MSKHKLLIEVDLDSSELPITDAQEEYDLCMKDLQEDPVIVERLVDVLADFCTSARIVKIVKQDC